MAGPFDFTSPGAAFTDQLTNALVQNKMQQRQSLLDSLGIQAQQRANQEADEMKQYRNYEMQMGRERDERERMNYMTTNMEPGADPEKQGWSPDDIAVGRKYGLFNQQQVQASPGGPDPTTGIVSPPTMKTQYTYIGTPQQQEVQKAKVSDQALLAGITDPTMKAALQADMAANNGLISPQMRMSMMPQRMGFSEVLPNGKVQVTGLDGKPIQMNPDGTAPYGLRIEPKPVVVKPPVIPHEHFINLGVDANGHTMLFDTDTKQVTTTGATPATLERQPQSQRGQVTFKEGLEKPYDAAIGNLLAKDSPSKQDADLAAQTAIGLASGATNATMRARSMFVNTIHNPQATAAQWQKIQANPRESGWTQQDLDQYNFLKDTYWPDNIAKKYWDAQAYAQQGTMTHLGNWIGSWFDVPKETPQ